MDAGACGDVFDNLRHKHNEWLMSYEPYGALHRMKQTSTTTPNNNVGTQCDIIPDTQLARVDLCSATKDHNVPITASLRARAL